MDKATLSKTLARCREVWETTIAELGVDGLERPGVIGDWRVRDVIAHFNGWDRWQTIQLFTAFDGREPTMDELQGGLEFPPARGRATPCPRGGC